jgi:hypothetical protein
VDLFDPGVLTCAQTLDDIEKSRIAAENRLRQMTRVGEDKDGLERGFALPGDHPSVVRINDLVEGLQALEHDAIKHLEKTMKAHPLGPWILAQKGIGLKQGARYLGTVGDPYWHEEKGRPRLVSELWSYCGYAVTAENGSSGPGVVGVIAPRRRKGERSNWSDAARMRIRLVSESCIKQRGHYRDVYDQAREQYKEAVHPVKCPRCGPAGKPAQKGSPLSLGHQHARALRRVSKEILKDLWLEAKRLYEEDARAAAS